MEIPSKFDIQLPTTLFIYIWAYIKKQVSPCGFCRVALTQIQKTHTNTFFTRKKSRKSLLAPSLQQKTQIGETKKTFFPGSTHFFTQCENNSHTYTRDDHR